MGLKVLGGGQSIAWKRDNVNMFAFHVEVPAGVASLDVTFDFISPPEGTGFTSAAATTSELAVLNWNQVLLYPEGTQPDDLQYQATLRVPNGWRYGTALPIAKESGNEIEFQPAPLTTLIDSPVSAGSHYRTIELGSDNGIPHYLHIAADSDRALEVSDEVIGRYKNLVKEAGALFGSQHFRSYHFLFTLSNHVAHFGLEHHESSDDRDDERTLIDPDKMRPVADLLAHEFVHSWNGKFRRPRGLISGDHDGGYDTPMKGDLLWVYEGLTEYLGGVLAARSGLWKVEDYRDKLAFVASALDHEAGRQWRPLEDTAVAAQLLYDRQRRLCRLSPRGRLLPRRHPPVARCRRHHPAAKYGHEIARRFLPRVPWRPGWCAGAEGVRIRGRGGGVNAVQPNDWAVFLNERVKSATAHAPLGDIEHAGWKLTYDADELEFFSGASDAADLSYSIGLKVKDDGAIADISVGGPAGKAGIAPAMRIVAVNTRAFTTTILREAIGTAVTNTNPIELLIRDGEYYKTYRVDYHGGEVPAPGPRGGHARPVERNRRRESEEVSGEDDS